MYVIGSRETDFHHTPKKKTEAFFMLQGKHGQLLLNYFLKHKTLPILKQIPCCPLVPVQSDIRPGAAHLTATANVSNSNVNGFLWKRLRADQSESFFKLREIYRLSPQHFYPPCFCSPQSLIVDQTPDGAKKKPPGAVLSSVTHTAISRTNDGFRCVIKQEIHKATCLFFPFFY